MEADMGTDVISTRADFDDARVGDLYASVRSPSARY